MPPPMPSLYEEDLFAVESGIIREIAAREDAVFVGRAAGWILRSEAGLLSVFLHAPEAVRVERVMRDYHMANRAAAIELVRESDHQRSRFLQSLGGLVLARPVSLPPEPRHRRDRPGRGGRGDHGARGGPSRQG